MAKVLRTDVWVEKDGHPFRLAAGTVLDDWAEPIVTNPKAFVEIGDEKSTVEKSEQKPTGYEEQTVEQLQDLLKERELPVSGNKAELIKRLEDDDAEKTGA